MKTKEPMMERGNEQTKEDKEEDLWTIYATIENEWNSKVGVEQVEVTMIEEEEEEECIEIDDKIGDERMQTTPSDVVMQQESPRRFEKKNKDFMYDLDTNPIVFVHEVVIVFVSVQISSKEDWKRKQFPFDGSKYLTKRMGRPRLKMKRNVGPISRDDICFQSLVHWKGTPDERRIWISKKEEIKHDFVVGPQSRDLSFFFMGCMVKEHLVLVQILI